MMTLVYVCSIKMMVIALHPNLFDRTHFLYRFEWGGKTDWLDIYNGARGRYFKDFNWSISQNKARYPYYENGTVFYDYH